jgi:hypothetical protein
VLNVPCAVPEPARSRRPGRIVAPSGRSTHAMPGGIAFLGQRYRVRSIGRCSRTLIFAGSTCGATIQQALAEFDSRAARRVALRHHTHPRRHRLLPTRRQPQVDRRVFGRDGAAGVLGAASARSTPTTAAARSWGRAQSGKWLSCDPKSTYSPRRLNRGHADGVLFGGNLTVLFTLSTAHVVRSGSGQSS